MGEYLIYKHTSPSGKSYIGITKNYEARCKAHIKNKGCRRFNNAIHCYGWDNFTHEILIQNLTLAEANLLEIEYINEHNTLHPNGYNLRTGGNVSQPCDETREKQRQAQLGMKHSAERNAKKSKLMKGRKLSPETIAKIVAITKGKKRTPEAIEKMAITKRGVKQSPEVIEKRACKLRGVKKSPEHIEKVRLANIGKIVSLETREKQRLAQLGKKQSQETIDKRVLQLKGKKRDIEHIEKINFTKNKLQFEKEFSNYLVNIKELTQLEIGTVVLSKLLNVDRTILGDRVKAGKFPNSYFKHPAIIIPINDVHDYYNKGRLIYGN